MAMATAIAHPKVMTIQPEFSALELLSSTPATTPSPRMIRIIVPINSPMYASIHHSFLERPSGRNVARRGQVGLHLVVELQERYGEPRHLQRGHVVPDVGHPPDLDALAPEHVGDVGVGDVELHQGRAAHTVDHHGHLGAGVIHRVTENPGHHLVDDPVGGLDVLALDPRLAVDADAYLHLVLADVEDGLPALRRGATRERHPHGTHVGIDPLGELFYLGQVFAVVGGGAADLVHEDGARDAATPARISRVFDRHVVVGDDVVGLYAFVLGELASHLEIEHVARVVLDHVEDPGPTIDGLARLEHLVRGGAGKHGAGAGGVEHARSHEAAVGRLVARAAAGDEGDLALHGGVGPNDDVGFGENADQAAVGLLHAAEHLLDDPLWRVDDLLHLFPFLSSGERGLDRFLSPLLGPRYGLFPPAVEPLALLFVHLRLVAAPETPPALELLLILPEPGRESSQVSRAKGGGLQGLRHLHRGPQNVGLELHHPAVGGGPAVGLEGRDVYARVGLHGLDGVARLVAHTFEGGACQMRPGAAPCEPDDGAPCVGIPVRRAQADEPRHEVHV